MLKYSKGNISYFKLIEKYCLFITFKSHYFIVIYSLPVI